MISHSKPSVEHSAPRVADALWRFRWLIGLIWLVSIGIALWYIATATKTYQVRAVLAPATADDLTAGLSDLASFASLVGIGGGGRLPGGTDVNIAIATLTGRQFTEDFVRSENLLPVLFASRWDSTAKLWRTEPPSLADAYWLFEKGGLREVIQDKRTGLITVQIEFRDGRIAAELLARMVARANQQLRSRAISEAEASILILNKELAATTAVEMKQALYSLIEGQIKITVLARVREDYALRVIDPPVVPDVEEYVWPRRVVILGVAGLLGLCGGVLFALTVSVLQAFRAARGVASETIRRGADRVGNASKPE